MKRIIAIALIATIIFSIPVYATPRRNRRIDEYRLNRRTKKSVKVTDTDDLHIYSNTYKNPDKGYSKFSNDEFSIGGKETPANDTYKSGNFDELHIPEQYQNDVWQPEEPVNRMGIDEFKTPADL